MVLAQSNESQMVVLTTALIWSTSVFISYTCYKLLIITLMKAASNDGPFGLLTAALCLISKCRTVMFITVQMKCLLACSPADGWFFRRRRREKCCYWTRGGVRGVATGRSEPARSVLNTTRCESRPPRCTPRSCDPPQTEACLHNSRPHRDINRTDSSATALSRQPVIKQSAN